MPTYRLSQNMGLDMKVITRVYQRLREALHPHTELEAGRPKGEIELDEAYFGWHRINKARAWCRRYERGFRPSGAGCPRVYQSRGVGFGGEIDAAHQNPQGLGV